MPNIRVPETPELGLRPSEVGVEARAATARRIGHLSNQVAGATRELAGETRQLGRETSALGDYRSHLTTATGQRLAKGLETAGDAVTDYFAHKEISQGAAEGARLTSDLTDRWNETVSKADPNDASLAGKFREETLEPALDKFRQSFNTEKGQLWAEHNIERTRNHFFQTTAADMTKMAAQAIHQNASEYGNLSTNTARKDPSSVGHLIQSVDTDIGAIVSTSPNLKGADAAKVRMGLAEDIKKNIVHAGAIGAAEKAADPEAAVNTFIERWPKYISAQEADRLAKAAKGFQRANSVQEKQALLYQKQLDQEAAKEEMGSAWRRNVKADDSGKIVISPNYVKELVQIGGMPHGPDVRTHINWIEAQSREKRENIVTDQATKAELLQRMVDPDVPTTREDILRADIDGKLAAHDRTALIALQNELEERPFKDPVFKETMAAAKDKFTHFGPTKLPGGEQNFASFMQQFLPEYLRQKRAGTLAPNALDMRDPNSLISQVSASIKPALPQQLQGLIGGNLGGSTAPITPPRPAPLKNMGDLQYNVITKQWRSKSTNRVYDAAGNEVK